MVYNYKTFLLLSVVIICFYSCNNISDNKSRVTLPTTTFEPLNISETESNEKLFPNMEQSIKSTLVYRKPEAKDWFVYEGNIYNTPLGDCAFRLIKADESGDTFSPQPYFDNYFDFTRTGIMFQQNK